MARRPNKSRSDPRKGRQDAYGRRAKREGFPARSVYKLEEIDTRLRILRPGQKVLDLGASPGSWTLYAAEKVGRSGEVLALDLQPARGVMPPQARFEVRDVMEVTVDELGGPRFDVVLSDMAPATTGHRSTDMVRSFNLFMRALAIAEDVLRPGGSFVGKIFQGEDFPEAQRAVRGAFEVVRVVRPKATRDVSYEVFLVGTGRRLPGKLEAAPSDEPTTSGDTHR